MLLCMCSLTDDAWNVSSYLYWSLLWSGTCCYWSILTSFWLLPSAPIYDLKYPLMPTFSYKIDSSDVYRQISNFRTFLLLNSGLATLACYLVHLQKEGSIKGEILLLYHHYAPAPAQFIIHRLEPVYIYYGVQLPLECVCMFSPTDITQSSELFQVPP